MLSGEIIEKIEERYPLSYALEWDNVGLLLGSNQKEVQRIYITLDATDSVISDAVRQQADLLITHHPLLFSPVKRITQGDLVGDRILKLIQNDITCYAMHTNYDVMGMADLSAEILRLRDPEVLDITCQDDEPRGIGKIALLPEEISLLDYCKVVKEAFHLEHVRIFGDENRRVRRVAISPGSGKSMIKPALDQKADVLITGDIGHHEGIDAVDQGLCIIDAGHYGIEHIFIEDMKKYLSSVFPEMTIITAPRIHPFQTV